jgi:Uma2 family endonuclease
MQARTTNVREALDHLPEAAVLVLEGITWEQYEELLQDLEDRPGVRVTYDQGRLEIVTTSAGHEAWKEFVLSLVRILSEELEIDLESRGGTTEKRKRDAKGTEPDTCFYLTHAARVIGKDEIDLNVDPPPDIVVEIDKSNQSLNKFPIYAAFGVPEIWRYVGKRKRAEFYELLKNSYVEIAASRFFPILTSGVLADFIEQSKTRGQTAALSAFRGWVRSKKLTLENPR